MRLTHLKLAGFKSFVDPTTLHLSGQRVAIVGPNGCGKSNVMEAIRWVLGESSARELRGDSMQDVIFNGSLHRKPVSRASVELHFDNSFGGAPGAWSQYAEIAVKRVLERDGSSSYIINNQQVRKRDITDLFLGTGVGSRAYAIIGQNTISRIVEAKPEELRVFLEEAAGVSRYKERRRETELRLRDTRENLLRVDDIQQEISKQISLLQAQAEVAKRYHQLKQELDTAHQLLWLLKKQQAAGDWEKAQRRVQGLVNELEAEIAGLRKHEAALEQLRSAHATAGSVMQQAQAEFYEASAALSNVEQQLKHAQENLQRAQMRQATLSTQQNQLDAQISERERDLAQQQALQLQAKEDVIKAQQQLQTSRAALPAHEAQQRQAQQTLGNAQSALAKAEQALQVSMTNLKHQRDQINQLQQRQQRLQASISSIIVPDEAQVSQAVDAQQQAQAQQSALQQEVTDLHTEETQQQARLQQEQQQLHEASRRIAQLEAQLETLHKIQQSAGGSAKLGEWLGGHGIQDNPRFWKTVRVSPAWELALESVLGERLNAILLDTLSLATRLEAPPTSLVLFSSSPANGTVPSRRPWPQLSAQVTVLEPYLADVLHDWLHGSYTADSLEAALALRGQLEHGEVLVCPEGHLVSRSSVKIHAAGNEGALHGVLERQREVEALEARLPGMKAELVQQQTVLEQAQAALNRLKAALAEKRQQQQRQTQQLQNLTLEAEKLRQQQRHAQERLGQVQQELEEVSRLQQTAQQQLQHTESSRAGQEAEIASLKQQRDTARLALTAADQALSQAREALRKAEHAAQELGYKEQTINNRIKDLKNSVKVFSEQRTGLLRQLEEVRQTTQVNELSGLQTLLEQAITLRQQREQALAAERNQLAGLEAELAQTEQLRMQSEQRQHPLRDKLEQARLSEQESRLYLEQCVQALAGADEGTLATTLQQWPGTKPADMERKAVVIQEQINALGAVNLAAIEQLAAETERASYLEAQARDLNEAIATLEDAIQRIDKETRGRLQHTFDEVNRHFAELFSTLFGGGQARLVLLGEEILDTGVQVFAQPPGKKNSTIHLLSGGEKALTALALVFAMFRLNPAPFCLMDEVDAPLDDSNTERFCAMVRKMSEHTQFVFISHNKIAMEMAQQLIGVTMQESGVSRVVEVDVEEAMRMAEEA
jgi:chromosome segregation protein